ncbi:putative alpha-1,2-fucosyltransferase [Brachyspira intermedia PWS/A]|uniref:Putative alpha-1,2-fucosyltransferase n=2 Tax=Brachyspira intermedia TaxID=84377 RepID=G0EQJ1_BRAIP|nr:putative alpha-1,2-fucosyltransferase [Brachyspira intermedia PWS/A]
MLHDDYDHFINKLVWLIPFSKHRNNFRNILNDIVNTMYKIEYLTDVNNSTYYEDMIIIDQMDGFSGQLGRYMLGEYIKDHYNKKVKYNLNWYSEFGLDCDKKEKREFDLLNCFQDIKIETVTKKEANLYKRLFYYSDGNINNIYEACKLKKNIYLYVFPTLNLFDKEYINTKLDIHKNLYPRLKGNNLEMYNDIIKHPASVSVHIRRGDIYSHGGFGVFNKNEKNYKEYIFKSIYKMIDLLQPIKPKFYFFSNDMKWVKNNILKYLNKEVDYIYNDYNKNQVYMDIYLLSLAKHMIFTIGAFSRTAYMFNKNQNIIVITADNINLL